MTTIDTLLTLLLGGIDDILYQTPGSRHQASAYALLTAQVYEIDATIMKTPALINRLFGFFAPETINETVIPHIVVNIFKGILYSEPRKVCCRFLSPATSSILLVG